MKRVKKMIGLILAIGMLLAVLPFQALAAVSGGQQMTDYQEFLKNVKTLEEYAVDYTKENPGKDPAALTIAYVRGGEEEYSTGFWNRIVGQEDSRFAAYVASREANYNVTAATDKKVNVTGLRNLGLVQVSNGDKVTVAKR